MSNQKRQTNETSSPSIIWLIIEMFIAAFLCLVPVIRTQSLDQTSITKGIILALIAIIPSEFLRQFAGTKELRKIWQNFRRSIYNDIKFKKIFSIKRHLRLGYQNRNDISMSNKRRLEKIDIWGGIIIAALGILTPSTIFIIEKNTSKKIDDLKIKIAESEMTISRGQFAANLIDPLIKGSESERIIAMILLESAGDTSLASTIFQALALYDENYKIRLQAIRALGRKGRSDVKKILLNIEKKGKTKEERAAAKIAEQNINFRENLRKAKIYFEMEKWEIAANYYFEATKYTDSTQVNIQELIIAKSEYDHNGYKNASLKYNEIFSKFYY